MKDYISKIGEMEFGDNKMLEELSKPKEFVKAVIQ